MPHTAQSLGLPPGITACLFDLDGVLTNTATVHAKAWKQAFDAFLQRRAERTGEEFTPFDVSADYGPYVDGKPRTAGVRDFLASRGITLDEGNDDDPPDAETVNGVGNAKNALLLETIERDGVEVFEGSRRYLDAVVEAGLRRAVVSSSKNTEAVLRVTGLDRLIEARIDGVSAQERGLAGKPRPDTYLAGAQALGVQPAQAAVFEDALSGVEAGRAGDFGVVIGVNRLNQAQALADHGADVVVDDLADLIGDQP